MSQHAFKLPLQWQRTPDAEYPFETTVDGGRWQIRLNDFPAEAMYTLIIAGQEISDFDDWPKAWQKAGSR